MNKCISLPCSSSIHCLSSRSYLGAHQICCTVQHGLNFEQLEAASIWELVLRSRLLNRSAVQNLGHAEPYSRSDVFPDKNEKINSELKTSKVTKYIYSFRII